MTDSGGTLLLMMRGDGVRILVGNRNYKYGAGGKKMEVDGDGGVRMDIVGVLVGYSGGDGGE